MILIMQEICLQCGDKGFDNAFIHCVKCLECTIHRYCLDVIPVSFDEFVHWVCDDCQVDSITRSAENKCDAAATADTCQLSDWIIQENSTAVESEKSTQQPEKEKGEDNLIQKDYLPDIFPLKVDMKRKKRKKRKRRKRENFIKMVDEHGSKKPRLECTKIDINHQPRLTSGNSPHLKVKKVKDVSESMHASKKPRKTAVKSGRVKHPRPSPTVKCSKEESTISFSESKAKDKGQRIVAVFAQTPEKNDALDSADNEKSIFPCTVIGKDVPKDMSISSAVNLRTYAEPILAPIWRGSFDMFNKRHDVLEGLIGHMSSKACQKVYEEVNLFQSVLHLEVFPHSDLWPERFKNFAPNDENIALFFFPSETSEVHYDKLVADMSSKNLALRGVFQNAELLIFISPVLPISYWRFKHKLYLWGLFRARRRTELTTS